MSAPFGIVIHSPLADLQVVQSLEQGVHIVQPARPHPLFEGYLVRSTASLGVVWVKGLGAPIEGDRFGTATRSAVDRVAEQLAQRYGRARKSDLLMQGSIWDQPQDWMSGLNEQERFYSYTWERQSVRDLPEDLETIFVGATPHEGHGACVVLEYASPKLRLAEAELERDMANLL